MECWRHPDRDFEHGRRAQSAADCAQLFLGIARRKGIGYVRRSVGVSPSGKAPVFGIGIPRFESWHPSHRIITAQKI